MLFIELLMFIFIIYGVLVICKKVLSLIGNGDLLGIINFLLKKWWIIIMLCGVVSFFLRDEGYLDYMVVFNEVDINYIVYIIIVYVYIVVFFFIRLCYFFFEGFLYINIFVCFKVVVMCMIIVL